MIKRGRGYIDAIDANLVRLLRDRAVVGARIGLAKADTGLPIRDASREAAILARVPREFVPVFKAVIRTCRTVQ